MTLVSAIAFLIITPPLAAQTNSPQSSQSEQFEAQKLEQEAWELESQGKYSEAIPLAQRALLLWEKALGAEHSTVAYSLNRLATLYKEQGNYSGAEPLYQRALAINEKLEGKDSPIVASILNNLAGLYQYQGNYSGAEQLLQRSLAINEKVHGKEHPDVATVLNNLALLYQSQSKYTQSEPLLRRSLAIREKVLKPENTLIASSLNNLAVVYGKQGNYNGAEPLLKRALAIVEKALPPGHPHIAYVLNNLAELYASQKEYSQAEPLLQRSLVIREQVLGQLHPLVANNLNNLARLYQGQGNINRAVQFNNRSTDIEEYNLDLILATGSESQKRDYIATLAGSTNAAISLHVQSAPNNPQAARLALTTILRRKGRVLDALTDSLQAIRRRLNAEDRALLDQLAGTRSQLASLTFKGVENSSPEQVRHQIATMSAQEQKLENAIARRSAEFRNQNQSVTIEAVQNLIPADAALVEMVLYKPYNPQAKQSEAFENPRYVAYILQPQGEPQWVDLGDAATINQAVANFRRTIRLKSGSPMSFKKAARSLDAMLMQPIRKHLGNKQNLLLSPDSQLNLIPFAALIDEKNQYLLENYQITYLSSGRDLIRLQTNLPSKENPVIVANPQFNQPGNAPPSHCC